MSDEPAADRRHYGERLRVLVVDDDADTLSTLAFILRDEGYVVQSAFNGREALAAVRVFRPDIIIHDIAVPGLSGYAVAQSIRYGFTDLRRPFMIAMSGVWTELPDRKVAEQMGFDAYLTKPCDTAVLLHLMSSFKAARMRAQ
jgi:two-component system alkaline phosphatase synthesis response regulator PhoP